MSRLFNGALSLLAAVASRAMPPDEQRRVAAMRDQRDEARGQLDDMRHEHNAVVEALDHERRERAAAYRRGVEDAARVCDEVAVTPAQHAIADRIRALVEVQPVQTGEEEDHRG